MKIAFIGHVCIDRNVIRGETEVFYGGGVLQSAITAKRVGADAMVLTKCAESDRHHYASLVQAGVDTIFLPSQTTTSIQNVYPSDNPDDRQSYLVSRAAPFALEDLDAIAADVVHLNPLWLGEFPADLLPALRLHAPLLAGDAQGFLRHADDSGRMIHRDLASKHEVLRLFDVFKVDSKEAKILTGYDDIRSAAHGVHRLGPKIVILTHRDGVCVFNGHDYFESPFTSFTLEGRTGRGDTCTAAFLVGMGRMNLRDATAFAAEVTSRKMQYRGPYRGY
jgi:sugar/nucleoside kinase (ribokinase family)